MSLLARQAGISFIKKQKGSCFNNASRGVCTSSTLSLLNQRDKAPTTVITNASASNVDMGGGSSSSVGSEANRYSSTTTRNNDKKNDERKELLLRLQDMLSPDTVEVSYNHYELERHGRGESYHPTKVPDAIFRPSHVSEIQTIVRYCNEHSIPIVPFGVGTSVEGHVCCLEGGISLDMVNFSDIQVPEMDAENDESLPDPLAVVGAGVTRKTLNEALRHTGMYFSVDPGADATIGGMVATGASGTTAVRYGTMRENILQVQCVLPDGTLVEAGTKALKNSAGYDLLGLMCGSEGTLGVITSVTVKLHPIPEHIMSAVCVFDSLKDAAEAVAMLKLCEIPMLRCELLDASSVVAFNEYQKGGSGENNNDGQDNSTERKVAPTLFLEFSASSETSLQEQVQRTKEICVDDFGASEFESTDSEAQRQELWKARHSLYYASLNLRPGANDAILTDACVPISKFAQVIEETVQDVQDRNVVGPCFGHAGDGNFHCILPVVENDSEEYIAKLHEVNNNLIRRTLDAGGTCTGEHGVGYGKIKFLEQQYGPGAVHMMKAVKQSLDPNNIMNPGKVVLI